MSLESPCPPLLLLLPLQQLPHVLDGLHGSCRLGPKLGQPGLIIGLEMVHGNDILGGRGEWGGDQGQARGGVSKGLGRGKRRGRMDARVERC